MAGVIGLRALRGNGWFTLRSGARLTAALEEKPPHDEGTQRPAQGRQGNGELSLAGRGAGDGGGTLAHPERNRVCVWVCVWGGRVVSDLSAYEASDVPCYRK